MLLLGAFPLFIVFCPATMIHGHLGLEPPAWVGLISSSSYYLIVCCQLACVVVRVMDVLSPVFVIISPFQVSVFGMMGERKKSKRSTIGITLIQRHWKRRSRRKTGSKSAPAEALLIIGWNISPLFHSDRTFV